MSLTLSETNGTLTARVVVAAEIGEALNARVEVLLPVGVGIVALGPGCVPGPAAPGVPSLRARVICPTGTVHPHDRREFWVSTTMPPVTVVGRIGVIATSDTPDPKPGNNFTERVVPRDSIPLHP